ncbi:Cysteine-rich secretory protein, allergen V5/Tpx-1-related family and CAP domain-containing protein [Strongyloides ratti]|uniref:Cysteine-rich secretory protein, allergen V5/Tpx-1-related family and CAP domain-containing protein n=1 Tax=Strongyloides ratti TaxID=34506 RepID=A0A090MY63_STRRB|nr:Cysteine-rich secretory protein, allergen V5/Tpx-1-related family and CAP domain-containing protein [Strongyloides ratti]CEF66634.1 Cysteine-rich secretory protein, allergen V5/Tpx-1-related family and CAP domain-containing protein [Strongyloides ratti]
MEYNNITYSNVGDMVNQMIVGMDAKQISETFIYILGQKAGTSRYDLKNIDCQPISQFIEKIPKRVYYPITNFARDGETIFKCCNKTFTTFREAAMFSVRKSCPLRFGKNMIKLYHIHDPPSAISCQNTSNLTPVLKPGLKPVFKPCIPPKLSCAKCFHSTKCLQSYSLSHKIWRLVWADSVVFYFNDKSSTFFKLNYLKEINLYRQAHNSLSLSFKNKYLSALAQHHANLLAKAKKLTSYGNQVFGTIMGIIDYRYGSYLFLTPQTEEVTALLWKTTRMIGIGIAKCGNLLYVAVKFYPKGNVKQLFTKNVLPVVAAMRE